MLAVLLAFLAAEPRAGGQSSAPAFDDAAFVRAVAIGGMYEGHLSYLVGAPSRNGPLRDFAAGVVADRIVGSKGLQEVAKGAGVELPTELDEAHLKQYRAFRDRMERGEVLDREFVQLMAKRHAAAVALFTRASKAAQNSAVREFAAAALPRIQKNLEAVENLDK